MNNSGYHPIKDNPHIPTHGSNIRRDNSMNELGEFYKIGWVCPKCGRVLSPDTSMCPCYYDGNKTTTATGTGYTYEIDWLRKGSTTIPNKGNK